MTDVTKLPVCDCHEFQYCEVCMPEGLKSSSATPRERLMMRLLDAARRLQGIYVWAVGLPDSPARGPGNDLADCLDEIRGLPEETQSATLRNAPLEELEQANALPSATAPTFQTPTSMLPTCDAPGNVTYTMKLGEGKWYCHGCGASELEPRCKYRNSVPSDRSSDIGERDG